MRDGVFHRVVDESNFPGYIALARMALQLDDAVANGQGDGGEVDGIAVAEAERGDVQAYGTNLREYLVQTFVAKSPPSKLRMRDTR